MHPTPTSLPPSSPPVKRSIGLKAMLTGAILLTVSTTAAIVHLPWLWTSSKNIDSVVDQLNQEITRQTSQEVGNLFTNVQSAQVLIQSAFKSGLVDLNDPQERETFYWQILQAHPNFTWVQIGFPNGNYLGLQRTPDGTINIINRVYDAASETTIRTQRSYQPEGATLIPVGQEERPETYYAPQRPWYQAAITNPGAQAWTDIYVFATGKIPGIDSSITLEQQNQLRGVISIAFDLKQVSLFLQTLQSERQGAIFVINSDKELVAFTNPQELGYTLTGGDSARLKTLQESTDPYLQHAYQAFQQEQVEFAQINQRQDFPYRDPETGEKYYVSLAPLGQLDWLVGTVIPEANYLDDINRNKQILVFVVSGFILLATGTAIISADRLIARPILKIANASAEIEAGRFEVDLASVAHRSDELGQLARVFEGMAQEVKAREERLKQQVQELKIEIDQSKRQKQVSEIVDTDFFQNLQTKARAIRNRDRGDGKTGSAHNPAATSPAEPQSPSTPPEINLNSTSEDA